MIDDDGGDTAAGLAQPLPVEEREAIVRRLRRLEGQVRGVQRMVQDGRDCREVLCQIAAVKAAAQSLGSAVLEHYVLACLVQGSLVEGRSRAMVREAVRQLAL